MKHGARTFVVFLLAGMFFVGCDVAPAKPSTTTTIPSGPTATINIVDNEFEPTPRSISAGTTVIWTNNGLGVHNVRDTDSASFSSPDLNENQSFSRTFTTTGTFDYECTNHPGMNGTITVTN